MSMFFILKTRIDFFKYIFKMYAELLKESISILNLNIYSQLAQKNSFRVINDYYLLK